MSGGSSAWGKKPVRKRVGRVCVGSVFGIVAYWSRHAQTGRLDQRNARCGGVMRLC